MFGKLLGAWLGQKAAGRNKGAKGAAIGYGAAAIASRSVPALAAVMAAGWAWNKYRGRKAASASYPTEATPRA